MSNPNTPLTPQQLEYIKLFATNLKRDSRRHVSFILFDLHGEPARIARSSGGMTLFFGGVSIRDSRDSGLKDLEKLFSELQQRMVREAEEAETKKRAFFDSLTSKKV